MSQAQAATNAAALRALAEQLEMLGYRSDDVLKVADRLARQLIADGYRRIEAIPPRGNGGSDTARAAALQATRDAVAAAHARTGRPAQPASIRQLQRLAVALGADGVTERQDRLDWCSAMVGRELTSSTQLSTTEARQLTDQLQAQPEPEQAP